MTEQPSSVQAKVGEVVADARPEPPPFPDSWLCRWWQWQRPQAGHDFKWLPKFGRPHDSLAEAKYAAERLVEEGCRNVRIVTIPGAKPQ